ncbi:14733_t:CDS:1, partial [Racocetra persica]
DWNSSIVNRLTGQYLGVGGEKFIRIRDLQDGQKALARHRHKKSIYKYRFKNVRHSWHFGACHTSHNVSNNFVPSARGEYTIFIQLYECLLQTKLDS